MALEQGAGCHHDQAPIKETPREHMIRAHGCTEAMVRWYLFGKAFGVGVLMGVNPGIRATAATLGKGNELETIDVFADKLFEAGAEQEGFRLGYRWGSEQ